jgi:hypothetical protein
VKWTFPLNNHLLEAYDLLSHVWTETANVNRNDIDALETVVACAFGSHLQDVYWS